MRRNTIASLLLVVALDLPLVACEDTKARQENEQLKARVAELVKENERLKAKRSHAKSTKSKHRHTTKHAATSPN